MKYPNAVKGVKTIMISEIVALAASIISVILSILVLPGVDIAESDIFSFDGIGVIVWLVVITYIAAYVTEIFGIMRAGKDEPAFKVSLYAIIAAMILTVLSGFFEENETVSFMIAIGGDVAQFFLVHYIIHGIMHLADHLGKPEIAKKGTLIFRVIYVSLMFEVIVRIFELIYGMERGEALAMPIDVLANIMKTVEYFLFLTYIIKGNKMLKESKAE